MTTLDTALFFNARADALEAEANALAGEVATWRVIALASVRHSRELWLQNQALRERLGEQRRQIKEYLCS